MTARNSVVDGETGAWRTRLGLYAPGCLPGYHLPYYAAVDGEFASRGLHVELSDPRGGLDTVKALGDGDLDACITSVAHYLSALQEDRFLAARFALMIARRTHLAAFVVERNGGQRGSPTRLSELDGARLLGDKGSYFTREYLAALRVAGVAAPKIVDAPHGQDLKLLIRGDGDVVVEFLEMLPRFASMARRHDLEIRALPFFEVLPDVYGSGLLIADHFLERSPEVVGPLIAAFREAIFSTRADPDSRVPALQQGLRGVSGERVVAAWRLSEQLIFDEEGGIGVATDAGWERTRAHFEVVNRGPVPQIRTMLSDASA